MYAEFGLMLPFTQGFPQEASEGDQHLPPFPAFEDIVSMSLSTEPPNLSNLLQTCAISEYDLGGDGDLFKAPKPIVEESFITLDPVVDVISMMSGFGSTIAEQAMDISQMESFQNEDLFKVFSNCKDDPLAKSTTGMPTSEASALDTMVATVQAEEYLVEAKDKSFAEGSLQKSISFGCLSSDDHANASTVEPCYLDVQDMNLGTAFGMRKVHSEGDIQGPLPLFGSKCRGKPQREIIGINKSAHGNTNTCPSFKLLATIDDVKIEEKIEERRKKLSRYRKKRTKRNFGRKIKYACRKALADTQPRIRGRFAKIEDRHLKNEEAN